MSKNKPHHDQNHNPSQHRHKIVLDQSFSEATFIVFDLETTGGNPERNAITEICALKYKNGHISDRFSTLVNPQMRIPPIVVKMTGITNILVKDAPTISEVLPDFIDFIADHTLVSHNTIGDLKFLYYYAHHVCQHELENFFLCTHLLVEKLYPEAPHKSLSGLGDFFKFTKGKMHRASEDAELTLKLFKKLTEKLIHEGYTSISDAIRLQGDQESSLRLGWAVPNEQISNIPHSTGVFALYDRHKKVLFKTSCLNLNREIKQFQKWSALPKPLLKIAAQSYSLSYEICTNPFEAMLKEHEPPLGRYHHYAHWHHRQLNFITFSSEKDGIRLELGPVRAHTIEALGPIPDMKFYSDILKKIGEIFALPYTSKHLICPWVYGDLIVSFLSNQMESYLASLPKMGYHLRYLVKTRERKQIEHITKVAKDLAKVSLHHMLAPISHFNGVLITRPNARSRESWNSYLIVQGCPFDEQMFHGRRIDAVLASKELWERILQKMRTRFFDHYLRGNQRSNRAVSRFRAQLKHPIGIIWGKGLNDHLAQRHPFTAHQSDRTNATLWWLLGQRYRSFAHFIPFDPVSETFDFESLKERSNRTPRDEQESTDRQGNSTKDSSSEVLTQKSLKSHKFTDESK